MDNGQQIRIVIPRSYAAVAVQEFVNVPNISIYIENTKDANQSDANLDAELVNLILSSAIGGAVGALSADVTKHIARALKLAVHRGIMLTKISYKKYTKSLEGKSADEVETAVIEIVKKGQDEAQEKDENGQNS